MGRQPSFKVRRASSGELAATPSVRLQTARERARVQRDRQLTMALNEAAALPASRAIIVEPTGDEKIATLRLALKRLPNRGS